jgi:hypothetical protein
MSDDRDQHDEAAARERARRRARVFGDVLPETTSDDRDEQGDSRPSRSAEEWLRRQVPPHHGD